MAMRFYETVWENILNRTVILSVLFFFWTILIESYFLFWPKDLIRANIFVGWLFTDIFFGFSPLIDIFHIVIWGICFFFSWLLFAVIKEGTRSGPTTISEYVIAVTVFSIFIVILVNLLVGMMFILFTILLFLYIWAALREKTISKENTVQ